MNLSLCDETYVRSEERTAMKYVVPSAVRQIMTAIGVVFDL